MAQYHEPELRLESFTAWLLATQIAATSLMGGLPAVQQTSRSNTQTMSANRTFKNAAEYEAFKREQAKQHKDYHVIERVITMLQGHGYDLSKHDIRLLDRRPPNTSSQSAAYVFASEPKIIYVGTWTNEFRGAMNNTTLNVIALAGQLVHEAEHVKGKGEYDAYKAQVTALMKLKAPSTLIQDVAMAGKQVTGKNIY